MTLAPIQTISLHPNAIEFHALQARISEPCTRKSTTFGQSKIAYRLLVVESHLHTKWHVERSIQDFRVLRSTLLEQSRDYKQEPKLQAWLNVLQQLALPKRRLFRSDSNRMAIKGRCVQMEHFLINVIKESQRLLERYHQDTQMQPILEQIAHTLLHFMRDE